MMLEDAVKAFKALHLRPPVELLVGRAAALILATQDKLPAVWDGIPVRILSEEQLASMPTIADPPVTRLLFIVVQDRLGRPCVVSLPA